jgi:hypothetical protein
MTNPLAPVAEPFTLQIAAILDRYPKINGYTLSLFRTFANSQRFLEKCVLNLLDDESPLSLRQREIVILRTTANLGCEYEWGVHVTVFGAAAGFVDAQIAATTAPKINTDLWEAEECLLLSVIDDICATGAPAIDRRDAFNAAFDADQQLEILALCGNYHTISFVAKTAELKCEPFAARFSA